jgi:hypothetical protein
VDVPGIVVEDQVDDVALMVVGRDVESELELKLELVVLEEKGLRVIEEVEMELELELEPMNLELELVVLEEKGLSVIEEVENVDDPAEEVVLRVDADTEEDVLLDESGLSVIEEVEKVDDDAEEVVVLTGTGLRVMDEVTVTMLALEERELEECRLVLVDVELLSR